jgi:hypothetical protein
LSTKYKPLERHRNKGEHAFTNQPREVQLPIRPLAMPKIQEIAKGRKNRS